MKKFSSIIVLALATYAFTGCERCATCTSVSEDPLTAGQELSEEVCASGREYSDIIEVYEGTGWKCTEN